jgi:hypothetical protein
MEAVDREELIGLLAEALMPGAAFPIRMMAIGRARAAATGLPRRIDAGSRFGYARPALNDGNHPPLQPASRLVRSRAALGRCRSKLMRAHEDDRSRAMLRGHRAFADPASPARAAANRAPPCAADTLSS